MLYLSIFVEGFVRVVTHSNCGVKEIVCVRFLFIVGTVSRVLSNAIRFLFVLKDYPRGGVSIFHPRQFRLACVYQNFIVRRVRGKERHQVLVVFNGRNVTVLTYVLCGHANEPLTATASNLVNPLRNRFTEGLVCQQILKINVLRNIRRKLTGGRKTIFHVPNPPLRRYLVINGQVSCVPVGLQGVVICPAFANPRRRIHVGIVMILRTFNLATGQIATFVPMGTGQEGPRLRPQLSFAGYFVRFLGRRVRITPTPISFVTRASTGAYGAYVIERVLSLGKVEVGMVIRVGNVRVVTKGSITRRRTSIPTTLERYQIGVRLITVDSGPFQVSVMRVVKDRLALRNHLHTVQVGPYVGLRAALVTFVGRGLREIPVKFKHFALRSNGRAAPQFRSKDVRDVHFKACLRGCNISSHLLRKVRLPSRVLLRFFNQRSARLSIC